MNCSASRQTVRHAIGVLEEEGIVARRREAEPISDNRMANLENKTGGGGNHVCGQLYFSQDYSGDENTLFERGYSVRRFLPTISWNGSVPYWRRHHSQGRCGGSIMEATKSSLPIQTPTAAAEADGTENRFIHLPAFIQGCLCLM